MAKVCGVLMVAAVFIAPAIALPYAPDALISGLAFSSGFQGPAMAYGVVAIPIMIQGLRLLHGDD